MLWETSQWCRARQRNKLLSVPGWSSSSDISTPVHETSKLTICSDHEGLRYIFNLTGSTGKLGKWCLHVSGLRLAAVQKVIRRDPAANVLLQLKATRKNKKSGKDKHWLGHDHPEFLKEEEVGDMYLQSYKGNKDDNSNKINEGLHTNCIQHPIESDGAMKFARYSNSCLILSEQRVHKVSKCFLELKCFGQHTATMKTAFLY